MILFAFVLILVFRDWNNGLEMSRLFVFQFSRKAEFDFDFEVGRNRSSLILNFDEYSQTDLSTTATNFKYQG